MATKEKIELAAVVVAALVGALGWFQWWRDRQPKIGFSVGPRVIVKPSGNERIIAVDVLNRGRFPVHLVSVLLRLDDGTGLFPNPIPGLPTLPAKLEPTDHFMMGFDTAELAKRLGNRPATIIDRAYCMDGAENKYQRKLTTAERQGIATAIEAVKGTAG